MNYSLSRSSSNGFSLLELLVVIAVLAVLTVIGISVTIGVRNSATTVQCAANLRSLYSSMSQYANEGGYWPSVNINSMSTSSEAGNSMWFVSLVRLGYVETTPKDIDGQQCLNAVVFRCPANQKLDNSPYPYSNTPHIIRPSYALNVYWGERNIGYGRVPLTSMTNPNAVLLLDTYNSYSSFYATNESYVDWNSSSCQIPHDIHSNGAQAVTGGGAIISLSPDNYPNIAEERYWDPRYN